MNTCWTLSKACYKSTKVIIFFFSFNVSVWRIVLIGFLRLHLFWEYIHFGNEVFFLLLLLISTCWYLLRISAPCSGGRLAGSLIFLSGNVFTWFLHQVCWSQTTYWDVLLLFLYSESICVRSVLVIPESLPRAHGISLPCRTNPGQETLFLLLRSVQSWASLSQEFPGLGKRWAPWWCGWVFPRFPTMGRPCLTVPAAGLSTPRAKGVQEYLPSDRGGPWPWNSLAFLCPSREIPPFGQKWPVALEFSSLAVSIQKLTLKFQIFNAFLVLSFPPNAGLVWYHFSGKVQPNSITRFQKHQLSLLITSHSL